MVIRKFVTYASMFLFLPLMFVVFCLWLFYVFGAVPLRFLFMFLALLFRPSCIYTRSSLCKYILFCCVSCIYSFLSQVYIQYSLIPLLYPFPQIHRVSWLRIWGYFPGALAWYWSTRDSFPRPYIIIIKDLLIALKSCKSSKPKDSTQTIKSDS